MRFSSASSSWSGLLLLLRAKLRDDKDGSGGIKSSARLCIHQIIETSSVGDIQRDAHLEVLVVLLVFATQDDPRLVQRVLAYGR